mgnify:FL=1
METYHGKSIFNGIAIGKICKYEKEQQQVKRIRISDPEAEINRFDHAREEAGAQLQALYDKALTQVGESGAMIFEIHRMMLDDDDYLDSVYHIIRSQQVNAEFAVASTGDNFSRLFASMDDEYMQERAADVKDISDRLIRILMGQTDKHDIMEPVIIMAEDLAPSETVQMDKDNLLAFVTTLGSSNSHTAILARTMGIPALVGIPVRDEWNGKTAIVDGHSGTLIIEPDDALLAEMQAKKEEELRQKQLLAELKGKETITKSGKKINLYANIGNVSDVGAALANDAGGIGLFRSEFLYLEAQDYPTEEEQFQAYKTVAENMAGKKVIIRTLDIGADKQAPYFNLPKEENPAMGFRAIRICLERPEIFKVQLRAILRASAYGTVSIMFPMITSVEEVRQIKQILSAVRDELATQQIPFGEVEIGIMIETPAAVMISDLLAKEVDFFSIGTNDLTQYTLAIDRQNEALDAFYNPHHEAILRMIRIVIDNGHKENCWVGICGELGSDTALTKQFIEMGIDELSVSPAYILTIRNLIRELP